jgi:hypothetical protein
LLHCGGQLLASKRFIVLESIQPKCDEVQRLIQTLNDRLEKRLQTLNKSCELQARIQKVSIHFTIRYTIRNCYFGLAWKLIL